MFLIALPSAINVSDFVEVEVVLSLSILSSPGLSIFDTARSALM